MARRFLLGPSYYSWCCFQACRCTSELPRWCWQRSPSLGESGSHHLSWRTTCCWRRTPRWKQWMQRRLALVFARSSTSVQKGGGSHRSLRRELRSVAHLAYHEVSRSDPRNGPSALPAPLVSFHSLPRSWPAQPSDAACPALPCALSSEPPSPLKSPMLRAEVLIASCTCLLRHRRRQKLREPAIATADMASNI